MSSASLEVFFARDDQTAAELTTADQRALKRKYQPPRGCESRVLSQGNGSPVLAPPIPQRGPSAARGRPSPPRHPRVCG
jgi:hypothetical protein